MAKWTFITNHGLVLGYISRKRVDRQNKYHINANLLLRHPINGDVLVGDLLQLSA